MTNLAPLLLGSAAVNGPAVSVIMPTYRRAQQIGETIRSILDGSWTDFEMLICDDGDGTDGTREAVKAAAAGDPRVKYQRNASRRGMPQNLNAGIERSAGLYIAVCHDHDLYAPDFLSVMLGTLMSHPTALYVHCAITVVDQEGNTTSEHIATWPPLTRGRDWLRFMLRSLHSPVCALTVVRREAHEKYGLYDQTYGFVADVELWMRLAAQGDVAYVARPLIWARQREAGHWANGQGGRHMKLVAAAQRRYVNQAAEGLSAAAFRLCIEANLIRSLLGNVAHRIHHAYRTACTPGGLSEVTR